MINKNITLGLANPSDIRNETVKFMTCYLEKESVMGRCHAGSLFDKAFFPANLPMFFPSFCLKNDTAHFPPVCSFV